MGSRGWQQMLELYDSRKKSRVSVQLPQCSHDWKEVQGIYRVYKDCIKCGVKWEDTHHEIARE